MNSVNKKFSFKQYKYKDSTMKRILSNPSILQLDKYHELFNTKFTNFLTQLNHLKNDKDTLEPANINHLLSQLVDLHLLRKIKDNALLGLTTGIEPTSTTKQNSSQISKLLESPKLLTEFGIKLTELIKLYPSLPFISYSQPLNNMKISNKEVRDIIARISKKNN